MVFKQHHLHGLRNISLDGLTKKFVWIYNNKELKELLVKNLKQLQQLLLKQDYLIT